MSVSSPELGNFLKDLRILAGSPPVKVIARDLGFTNRTLYYIFSGESGNWVTIEKVLKYLSASSSDLAKARRMWSVVNTNQVGLKGQRPASPEWALGLASQLDEILAVLINIERHLDPATMFGVADSMQPMTPPKK